MSFLPTLDLVQHVLHDDTKAFFAEYSARVAQIDSWSEEVAHRLEEYSLRPGKAFRPMLLVVAASASLGLPLEDVVQRSDVRQLMKAVEFIHKRLLMADDVADQDELRHEHLAFHILFARDLAQRPHYASLNHDQLTHVARSYTEVAGVWYQALSMDAMVQAKLSPEIFARVMEIYLQRVFEKTASGWYLLLDQNFEPVDETMSEERFLKGLELVTGEYTFVAPLLMGAALGSRYEELRLPLEKYGQLAGLLHQVTDDILGVFGDPEVTGKPAGNDLREGKKTLLVQYAYQKASPSDRAFLSQEVGNQDITADSVERIRTIMRESGALDKTQEKVQQLVQASIAAAQEIPHEATTALLSEIVKYIATRKK